jgi:predicted DNA binding CopG/RHH family protein
MSSDASLRRYRDYASATLTKNQRVNIRLSTLDLADIQARAAEEGIPYQTLMTSVLHKFATGRLLERKSSLTSRSRRATRKRTVA